MIQPVRSHSSPSSSCEFHRNVRPFLVMDLHRQASALEEAGHPVCHLEAGLPEFQAPGRILDAAREAIGSESLGYTPSRGLSVLCAKIAEYYQRYYHLDVDPGEVLITTGSSGGFQIAFLAAFRPAAAIALTEPGYPAYRNILNALGFSVVSLPVSPAHGFRLRVCDLEQSWHQHRFEGLVLANPANPTGAMIAPCDLKAIVDFCDLHDIRIISDEIYHRLEWGEPACTIRAFSRRHIVVNSFSKFFAMTGWRVGWVIMPEGLGQDAWNLQANLFICAPAISQYASLAAFECDDVLEGYKAIYRTNRSRLLAVLQRLGIDCAGGPDGSFYIYADIGHLTNDSTSWCHQLLRQTGVALAPGEDFDPQHGKRCVRFAFARSEQEVIRAIDRLEAYLSAGDAGSPGQYV
ncbi:MAG: aminotransferase class I/II-fold pyridoxal phosphate-dependent enzyme [Pseudomonadota bacterium]